MMNRLKKPAQLEREIEDYNPDKDVKETGGMRGIELAEQMEQERICEEMIEDNIMDVYGGFLRESRKIRRGNCYDMRLLLSKHFERFSRSGKRPVFGMEDSQVFGAYKGIVRYAERAVREIEEKSRDRGRYQ